MNNYIKEKLSLLFNGKTLLIGLYAFIIIIIFSTYASQEKVSPNNIVGKVLRVDENAYGELNFDSSFLDFKPILDNTVNNESNNVIHIPFTIGGSKENDIDNIVYNISLDDLLVDCSLLSPYLKWKLLKNGSLISEGSLDYRFDTIDNGRLVLTPIQQDLKEYSTDKSTYDNYDFYMWISDSCQEEDITKCFNKESQDNLIGKRISGKIQVELYADRSEELVRKPSEILNTNSCIVESGDEIYENR